jgi:hypothetical protein
LASIQRISTSSLRRPDHDNNNNTAGYVVGQQMRNGILKKVNDLMPQSSVTYRQAFIPAHSDYERGG